MIRFIILLLFICYSCSPGKGITDKPSAQPIQTISKDSLYLHLTGGFKHDSLVLEYADIRIIESDVTTGKLGFAKAYAIPREGIATIHVRLIRPNKSYSTEIMVNGNNFIEVWYCKDDLLKHYCRNEPFKYEE